ncbi:MAG: DUF3810 domain-containing protein, partial [Oscillospiraceae bacterium]|nr:DUF3810 domain-containing protein [Oscillospiraceae bacterium]
MLPKRRARLIGNTVASGALLAFATLLVTAVRNSAAFAGSVYLPLSRAVSGWLGFLFSFSSYAVAETLLVTASAVLVFCLARSVVRSVRERTAWPLLLCFTGLILCAAWVYFLFMLFWGGCYYAPKLEARLDMEPGQPTETMLVGAAESYLDDVLLYAGQVPRDGSGSVTEGGFDSLASEAVHCIRSLQLRYPDLFGGGIVTHPKRAVSYPFLGMLGIAGIYCPWTGESVVNTISTAPFLPSTMCHELAHRLGSAPG